MPRFVLHALLFAALQIVVLTIVWRACPDDPNHYMAATLDKHARLESAGSPRVIFVGGSSVGFGVDSRAFEPLGLAPVNMGLNDGLGLGFMLGEVAPVLRAGDVVIIAPETHLYWTGSQHDAIWAVVQRRPANLRCLLAAGPRELANVSDQSLHFLARKLRCAAHQMTTDRDLPNLYLRSSFDGFGDFVAHRELPSRVDASIDQPWPGPDALDFDRSIAALSRFAARCERVHARCFLAWSPVRNTRFVQAAAVFARLEARLEAEVPLVMLERASEQAYPEQAFFDRGPHLTGPVARRRSEQLATRLAAALAGRPLD
jgi:hypothetical protein